MPATTQRDRLAAARDRLATMTTTTRTPELNLAKLRRLADHGHALGLRLIQDGAGAWYCTVTDDPSHDAARYFVTAVSCECGRFARDQRCVHQARLLCRLGWLAAAPEAHPVPVAPPATEAARVRTCPHQVAGCGLWNLSCADCAAEQDLDRATILVIPIYEPRPHAAHASRIIATLALLLALIASVTTATEASAKPRHYRLFERAGVMVKVGADDAAIRLPGRDGPTIQLEHLAEYLIHRGDCETFEDHSIAC